MVSHLTSFRYIEVEREVHETPFQAFEAIQMIKTSRSEDKKPAVSMSSLEDARAVAKNGHPEGWGRVLDLSPKFDKLDLGFNHSRQGLVPEAPKFPNVLTPVKFASDGLSILVMPMLLVMMMTLTMTLITGFDQMFQVKISTIEL